MNLNLVLENDDRHNKNTSRNCLSTHKSQDKLEEHKNGCLDKDAKINVKHPENFLKWDSFYERSQFI